MSITSASFALKPLHEEAYELGIAFNGADGTPLSRKSFTFEYAASGEQGELLDVYSQNGCCNKSLFSKRDVKEIQAAGKMFAILDQPAPPTVVVLDLKDSQEGYSNAEEIALHESAVIDFYSGGAMNSFLSKTRAGKVHAVLQKMPLDFVICEGSLKHRLLHLFSDGEAGYLLERGQGAIDLCVFTEYFMNGLKFGHTQLGLDCVRTVSGKKFEPVCKSTVWYPGAYKDVYGLDGAFAQTLKPVFSIKGAYHEKTEITSIEVSLC